MSQTFVARAMRRAQRLAPPGQSAPAPAPKPAPGPSAAEVRAARRIRELEQTVDTLRAFRRVVLPELGLPHVDTSDDDSAARRQRLDALERIGDLRADAAVMRAVRTGASLDTALIGSIRTMLHRGSHVNARATAQSLLLDPRNVDLGHLGVALVARHQRLHALAVQHLDAVAEADLVALAPQEWLDELFRFRPEEASAAVERHREVIARSDALALAVVRFAYRERRRDLGRGLLHELRDRTDGEPELSGGDLDDYTWLLEWEQQRDRAEALPQPRPGHLSIGVLDYKQPDFLRQSSNIGDYVQTIGAMSHLVRHDVAFTGDPELAAVAEDLQTRVRQDLRVAVDGAPTVHLVGVSRDASRYDAIPESTFVVDFGWQMHSVFGGAYDFPLHPNLRPIFTSFHVQRREMLTPEAIAYLRRYAPVGCRDWTTVYLLLSLGVPAFFSGCTTTVVDSFFTPRPPGSSAEHADPVYVDTAVPRGARASRQITHVGTDVARAGLGENIAAALTLLESYRDGGAAIVTSRLHCYLPATALGCQVDFVPRRRGDVRFDGLLDLVPGSPGLLAMQDGLRETLGAVYGAVLAGADHDEVLQVWRDLTEHLVTQARERLHEPLPELTSTIDLPAAVDAVLAGRVDRNLEAIAEVDDVVDVVVAADQNLREQVPVTIESIVAGSSRPVHIWMLSRGHVPADHDRLAALFPTAALTFLPCDAVDHGDIAGMIRHITVATMDRLLLPLLLPDVDRVVYHDIDAVTVGDIAELYDTDLQGHPIAARSAQLEWAERGFSNVYRSAQRLPESEAFELRRRMHATVPYEFVSFNAGVMVLDLARMRADDFCVRYLPFAERYGMNDQEVLNCYAGDDRAVLDRRWNALPQQELVRDPHLIHWAGPAKPWGAVFTLHQDVWERLAQQVAERERSLALG